jgi:hypothetical protein
LIDFSGPPNFQSFPYEICHSSLIILQKQKTQKLTKTLENNKAKGLTSANQGVQIHNIWHSSSVINSIIHQLQQQFPLKDLVSLTFFLGIQATHTFTELHLSQTKYITDLLHRVKMLGAKPASSPCPAGTKLSALDGDSLSDPTEYRSVVGALLYCTLTKPEISFSVNQLCQHMHSPTTTH